MPFAPGVIRAPACAVRFAADASVEHVARGEVAVRPHSRGHFRRVALLPAQTTELAKELTLCERRARSGNDHRGQEQPSHTVASPPSTTTFSTTPPPFRRNAAASWYSGDSKHATPCSSVANSMTTKRWKSCGPSLIL